MTRTGIINRFLLSLLAAGLTVQGQAETTGSADNDTTKVEKNQPAKRSRFQLGGYGEAVVTRNFYSDNVFRHSSPDKYKNAHGHGQFDLPHVVIMMNYDFGKGWTMNSEIEFEHGGTGSAVEMEAEEVGEFENETERGGEVALEQLWIQKSFTRALNLRMGHMIVPVGLTNGQHLPTQFFTVYRPEGENTIMPCTWHETGISLWGQVGKWRYEAMLLPGLNSAMFSKDKWIHDGSYSPFEFRVANNYAVAVRIDNYSIPGLRLGISGYYGHSFNNTLQSDFESKKYKGVKGAVSIGAFDFEYNKHNWIARGHFDYGHLGDADKISDFNRSQSSTTPYSRTLVGKQALAGGVEAGYDLFSRIKKLRDKQQKLYIFGRYEYYDTYEPPTKDYQDYPWTERHRLAAGLNYFPLKEIVIKAEYSHRFLRSKYNNEPSISLSVAYAGFFIR